MAETVNAASRLKREKDSRITRNHVLKVINSFVYIFLRPHVSFFLNCESYFSNFPFLDGLIKASKLLFIKM